MTKILILAGILAIGTASAAFAQTYDSHPNSPIGFNGAEPVERNADVVTGRSVAGTGDTVFAPLSRAGNEFGAALLSPFAR